MVRLGYPQTAALVTPAADLPLNTLGPAAHGALPPPQTTSAAWVDFVKTCEVLNVANVSGRARTDTRTWAREMQTSQAGHACWQRSGLTGRFASLITDGPSLSARTHRPPLSSAPVRPRPRRSASRRASPRFRRSTISGTTSRATAPRPPAQQPLPAPPPGCWRPRAPPPHWPSKSAAHRRRCAAASP